MSGNVEVIQALNELTNKSDGKDKLLATAQYVLMYIAAGNSGMAKDMQVKIAAARKVFRILKPLDTIMPVVREPYLPGKKPLHAELLPKLRSLCMTVYFSFDHLVWLGSVSFFKDKSILERLQKTSLWGWFLGSLVTITLEAVALLDGTMDFNREVEEEDNAWEVRKAAMHAAIRKRVIVLVHAITQALLASGLLQLQPLKPRTTATFGIIASAMNCYMLTPSIQQLLAELWGAPKPALKLA